MGGDVNPHCDAAERVREESPRAASESAATWLRRGQAHEARGGGADLAAAAGCYQRAIAQLAPPGAPVATDDRRALAIAWMNLGNVQHLLAARARSAAAFCEVATCFLRAIELLEPLSLGDDPTWRNSLGAAWLNRGAALEECGDEARLAAALASADRALASLALLPLAQRLAFRLNLAGAWLLRARVLLRLSSADLAAAGAAARRALALVAADERAHAAAAEIGLKARHALLRALVVSLDDRPRNEPHLAEASDLVEDGLDVFACCSQSGANALLPLALDLLRAGALVYAAHQPQFVGEFLREHAARLLRSAAPAERDVLGAAIGATFTAAEEVLRQRWLNPSTTISMQRIFRAFAEIETARAHVASRAPDAEFFNAASIGAFLIS